MSFAATNNARSDTEHPSPMLRLFSYLRRYRLTFLSSCSASIINKILDLMPPLIVAWVIDVLNRKPPAWFDSLSFVTDGFSALAFLSILTVVIFSLESLFQWLYQRGFMNLAQRAQHDLRVDAYNTLQNRETAFFENHRMGETMSMLNDDVNQLERFLNGGFNDLVQLATLFLFAGSILMVHSPELAAIGLAPLPLIVWGSIKYRSMISPRYRRIREAVGTLSSRLENNLSGMTVIKSFTAEKFEARRVEIASQEYRDANLGAIRLSAIYVPLIRLVIAIGFAAVLMVGGYWAMEGLRGFTPGKLVLFAMMTQRLLWPLTAIGKTFDLFERARAGAQRTFSIIDTPAIIQDPSQPIHFKKPPGRIDFEDVVFDYQEDVPVLNKLRFTVMPGETLGIAGPTGAGKSTIIKLLLRLYDARDGRVTLDGIDVRDITQEELRKNISLVSQDVYLFHGSIGENIGYGSQDARRADIEKAARAAHLHDFITGLPQSYDTIVGERGIKLSGGQRQRLSIARAVLKNAPIFVLDEATSSVDTETEQAIQNNLKELTRDQSGLIIAHRLSSIRDANRIIVIDGGRVAEEGSHEDLLSSNGIYAGLWRVQSGIIS